MPARAQRSIEFLHSLDCFYYRSSDDWLEAFGRVVFEAMACGLPVVCGRRGGYADYIVHGVNGFLFDTSEQAVALIRTLSADPALRSASVALHAGQSRRSTAAAPGAARSPSSSRANDASPASNLRRIRRPPGLN